MNTIGPGDDEVSMTTSLDQIRQDIIEVRTILTDGLNGPLEQVAAVLVHAEALLAAVEALRAQAERLTGTVVGLQQRYVELAAEHGSCE